VSEVGEVTFTPVPCNTTFDDAFVDTKLTVVLVSVALLTNPVPVTVSTPVPVRGPCVLDSAVTVGFTVLLDELFIVIPEPHVPLGGVRQNPGLTVGLELE
jgi:hypothetical protein